MSNIIEMHNVYKRFKSVSALEGVSFSVKKGEIFGLLGPSGAGKTTIIKILIGQLYTSSGTASLLEKNSDKLSSHEYVKIGTVLDESGIYKRLNVYDNLSVFADIYGVDKSNILPILNKVGLDKSVKTTAEKLSKGMLQRLVFARALLNKPHVLFLDEPTSGLDPSTVRSIHELILEQQQQGCTVFLTTHNMEEASSLCNKVALLNNGKIVETDTPDALCTKYNSKNSISIQLKDGNRIELPNNPAFAQQIYQHLANGSVEKIHSSEPNLESVFIELTGRKLV